MIPSALAPTSFAPRSVDVLSSSTPVPISSTRVTVLPRAEGDGASLHLVHEGRARYEPIRPIASGGMGEVLLMHDQDIARPVAVKRLLPELDDTSALLRFVEEIRTIGQLEHPNIVPIHDVGVDEQGRYFFVMKYVEGETLAAILERLREGDAEYHRSYPSSAASRSSSACSTRWPSRTRAASSTATSSRPTSWSAASARWS